MGQIYIILDEETDALKIGYTDRSPKNRLAGLQVGNPRELKVLAAFPGTPEDEAEIHENLKVYNIRGEWFKLLPYVIQYLALEEELACKKHAVDRLRKSWLRSTSAKIMAEKEALVHEAVLAEVSKSAELWQHINGTLVGWRPRDLGGR